MSSTTVPINRPFQYLVNPDGRTDGWTKVYSVDSSSTAETIVASLNAAAVSRALKLRVEFDIVMAAAESYFSLRPNGLSTNQSSLIVTRFGGGGSVAASNVTSLPMSSPNEADTVMCSGWCELTIAPGRLRRFEARSGSWTTTTPRVERSFYIDGYWTDTSTALTSVVIHQATSSTSIRAGSRFRVTLIG